MNLTERVILVDQFDNELGVAEKIEAHNRGLLHRAFSIFVFDSADRLLIQKRAIGKYHSGGLWSNSCCGHPRPGELTISAAERRLREELGFSCSLRPVFDFVYRAEVDRGMTEHEFDHIFIGRSDVVPAPNPTEIDDYKWIDFRFLKQDVSLRPDQYTLWLRTALDANYWDEVGLTGSDENLHVPGPAHAG